MKLPLISCKCKLFFDLIWFFFLNEWSAFYFHTYRWHWWKDTSVREAVLLYFADTSSICYKWILLKNVSVMHTRFLPSLLWADDHQREWILQYFSSVMGKHFFIFFIFNVTELTQSISEREKSWILFISGTEQSTKIMTVGKVSYIC